MGERGIGRSPSRDDSLRQMLGIEADEPGIHRDPHAGFTWRVTLLFAAAGDAHGVLAALKSHAAAEATRRAVKRGALAYRDGNWLRVYAESEQALVDVVGLVAAVIAANAVTAEERIETRTASDGTWGHAVLASPAAGAVRSIALHDGPGPWGSEAEPGAVQVRFATPSRDAAETFARALSLDGYEVHQAGAYVILYADTVEEASALGSLQQAHAPQGTRLFIAPQESIVVI